MSGAATPSAPAASGPRREPVDRAAAAPAAPAVALAGLVQLAPILAIVRTATAGSISDVADALVAGGIRVLEVSLTVPGALSQFPDTLRRIGDRAMLGAGTVLVAEDAARAVDAGARFLVSPCVDQQVLAFATAQHIPIFCGALTATEIHRATQCGAAFVKLFPGGSMGPDYLKEMRAPFPSVKFVPTGGITAAAIPAFRAAGAAAVGMGSALSPPAAVLAKDWPQVTRLASHALQLWHDADRPPGDT